MVKQVLSFLIISTLVLFLSIGVKYYSITQLGLSIYILLEWLLVNPYFLGVILLNCGISLLKLYTENLYYKTGILDALNKPLDLKTVIVISTGINVPLMCVYLWVDDYSKSAIFCLLLILSIVFTTTLKINTLEIIALTPETRLRLGLTLLIGYTRLWFDTIIVNLIKVYPTTITNIMDLEVTFKMVALVVLVGIYYSLLYVSAVCLLMSFIHFAHNKYTVFTSYVSSYSDMTIQSTIFIVLYSVLTLISLTIKKYYKDQRLIEENKLKKLKEEHQKLLTLKEVLRPSSWWDNFW